MKTPALAAMFESFSTACDLRRGSIQHREMKRAFMSGAVIAVKLIRGCPERIDHVWREAVAEVEAIIADDGCTN